MDAATRLNAGLLVGREDAVGGVQRAAFPAALVEVEDATGLLLEVGDPAGRSSCGAVQGRMASSVSQRQTVVSPMEATISLARTASRSMSGMLRVATEAAPCSCGKLAGERLNGDDDAGGKSGQAARRAAAPRDRPGVPRRSACATC